MTKKEIFDIEQQNYGKIILYKEGSFWIAYERSAYWLYHGVKKYKPNKRYINTVGQEVISLGFPDRGRSSPMAGAVILEMADKKIVLEAKNVEATPEEFEHNFSAWKENVGIKTPRPRQETSGGTGGGTKYDNLPVYKEVYDLTLQVYKSSQHMQRDYRYTLGEKIKTELVDMTTAVYSANVSADKEPYIVEARRLIQVLRVQMRLLHDLGQVSVNNMAAMNLSIDSISRQLTAWHNSTVKRKNGNTAVGAVADATVGATLPTGVTAESTNP